MLLFPHQLGYLTPEDLPMFLALVSFSPPPPKKKKNLDNYNNLLDIFSEISIADIFFRSWKLLLFVSLYLYLCLHW